MSELEAVRMRGRGHVDRGALKADTCVDEIERHALHAVRHLVVESHVRHDNPRQYDHECGCG